MAVAAIQVGYAADTMEVRGSRRALLVGLLALTLTLVALPPLIGLLVLSGLVS